MKELYVSRLNTMKTDSDTLKLKRGRRPSGRVTEPVTIRMEKSLHDRLKQSATTGGVTQTQIMEDALNEILPPCPQDR